MLLRMMMRTMLRRTSRRVTYTIITSHVKASMDGGECAMNAVLFNTIQYQNERTGNKGWRGREIQEVNIEGI